MATTWTEASLCPRDQAYTGKVVSRKPIKGGGGQLVTLECPETNCGYHSMGWIVQILPDGSIPDAVAPGSRDKQWIKSSMSATRAQQVRDMLAEQAELEQKPGAEVPNR
jgi:hypothetical protein